MIEFDYYGKILDNDEYSLTFTYRDKADLKEQIDDLFDEIYRAADIRNCVVDDLSLTDNATGLSWDEGDEGWR